MSSGISLNFHGKRTAQEIDKKVRPRQTLIKKELSIGSREDQARNMVIEGENSKPWLHFTKSAAK